MTAVVAFIGMAGAVLVALVQGVLLRRKTRAEVRSLESDGVDKLTSAYHRLVEDQERKLEANSRKIEALEARVTLAEARAIKSDAEAAASRLSEARCLQDCADLRTELNKLKSLVMSAPAVPHVVTTVTTVDAPGEPPPV